MFEETTPHFRRTWGGNLLAVQVDQHTLCTYSVSGTQQPTEEKPMDRYLVHMCLVRSVQVTNPQELLRIDTP